MRSEEIMKEANGYRGEGSAYIHAEIYKFHCAGLVVSGEEAALVVTLYSLIEAAAMSCRPDDASPEDVRKKVRSYIKSMRYLFRTGNRVVRKWEDLEDEET